MPRVPRMLGFMRVFWPVRVLPRPIHANLDAPVDNSETKHVIEVVGWAASLEGSIKSVQAFLNGVHLGDVTFGFARGDVAEAHPWISDVGAGFEGRFAIDEEILGRVQLKISIVDDRGARHDIERTLFVQPEQVYLELDTPRPGAGFAGRIEIGGWAASRRGSVQRVEAWVGDQPLGSIPFGYDRPDVVETLEHISVARPGFWAVMPMPPFDPGPLTLVVRAFDDLGAVGEREININAVSLQAPQLEIERAAWKGNRLEVEGWGLWPPNLSARCVRVSVDGELVGTDKANLSRPDLTRCFPVYGNARRCGFRFSEPYACDTGREPRQLRVELESRDGHLLHRDVLVTPEPQSRQAVVFPLYTALREVLGDFKARFDRPPAILDWDTDLGVETEYRDLVVFRPPKTRRTDLPYASSSIDVVIAWGDDPGQVEEARRVADTAVVLLDGRDMSSFRPDPSAVRVEWLRDKEADAANASRRGSVSIIIPVHNHSHYTAGCLERVLETLPKELRIEIIVVDDASTDETPEMLARFGEADRRVKPLRIDDNLGFIGSCNLGAKKAEGDILVFLNNDTLPEEGWLEPLVSFFDEHPDAGAVGGKLMFPDGILQEAGAVIFSDASGYNFGKFDADPDAPLYNHVREVDYCSGALLATPRALFEELGGFDKRFAPAYYEDADYCFSVRDRGLKVYFQPESTVVHFEGVSSGSDIRFGVKKHQVCNRIKFQKKWKAALKAQPPPPDEFDLRLRLALAVRGDERLCEPTARG